MMQAQYTNIGGVESLWLTHSVANSGLTSLAAPRWYQIDVTSGNAVTSGPLQQSTWAPDTAYSRWMGSLALDKYGNMALGYSRASSAAYPAIYYAGRLASDPVNTLGQSETLLHQGNGYQCCTFSDGTTNSRWGDYSAMTIDPDGCTFWYTTEYYDSRATSNIGNDWRTRIGSFKFPGCISEPDFVIGATPTTRSICAGSGASYAVALSPLNGFNASVTLAAAGQPVGATATFTLNPVTPPGNSTLTIANTAGATTGVYQITVAGTAGALNHAQDVTLNVDAPLVAAPTLTAPANSVTGVTTTPTFTWNAVVGASSYELEVATDPAFGSLVIHQTGLIGTSYTPGSALSGDTVYYWRVKATNLCGAQTSPIFGFRTQGGTACVDVIGDGGFEAGRPNPAWSESSAKGYAIIDNSGYARTGAWFAWLGGANDENAQAWQAPTITAAATSASLIYWYQISSGDSCNRDYGYLKINGSNVTTYNLCTTTDTADLYVQATHDMLTYKGAAPEVRFQAITNNRNVSSLFIDDIVLNVCTASTVTTGDYSDLSASYGVAWHTGSGALRLGSQWTTDSSFAAGSDNASDDGVSFIGAFQVGQPATVQVNVQGTPSAGRWLRLWFDWDGDGVFAPTELMHDAAALSGVNDLTLSVPAQVAASVAYRARLYDERGDAGGRRILWRRQRRRGGGWLCAVRRAGQRDRCGDQPPGQQPGANRLGSGCRRVSLRGVACNQCALLHAGRRLRRAGRLWLRGGAGHELPARRVGRSDQ